MSDVREKTIELINDLKATCQNYGMGNDGNEYKIITQVFLYKFLNDKFGYEIKKKNEEIRNASSWEEAYIKICKRDKEGKTRIFRSLSTETPRLDPEHLVLNLWRKQGDPDIDLASLLDKTLVDISEKNKAFSTKTSENVDIPLFERLTTFVEDEKRRREFAISLITKLRKVSFEAVFKERNYDFFAAIFEYLIKDYNTAGGGTYAEYYTPHAVALIMARLLVGNAQDLHNIECYDPSAGTGTLLIALGHMIGEDRCTIFAQDISQKSNKMLKLNLILNGLTTSLRYAVRGDTLCDPYHMSDDGKERRQFDFVVSNPPFKMDFSETRDKIAKDTERFWAGVPAVTKGKNKKMAIYTCFIQHVVKSMKPKTGKAAIVVPTGFLTASSGVEKKILETIVGDEIVYGCITMPSNIFANTQTNVSVLFLDNSKTKNVILIDASKLGEEYKEAGAGGGKNITKKRLRKDEVEKIVDTFIGRKPIEDFSVVVTKDQIMRKRCSLSAVQYMDVKIEYTKLSQDEFDARIREEKRNLQAYFDEGAKLQKEIMKQLEKVKYEPQEK